MLTDERCIERRSDASADSAAHTRCESSSTVATVYIYISVRRKSIHKPTNYTARLYRCIRDFVYFCCTDNNNNNNNNKNLWEQPTRETKTEEEQNNRKLRRTGKGEAEYDGAEDAVRRAQGIGGRRRAVDAAALAVRALFKCRLPVRSDTSDGESDDAINK
jgi:hypothetical protein